MLGALLCALAPTQALSRSLALLVAAATLTLSLFLASQTDFSNLALAGAAPADEPAAALQHTYQVDLLSPSAVAPFKFHLGADTVSVWMVLLTGLLFTLSILASFGFIKERQNAYFGWVLLLMAAVTGVFLARDAILLYVFFELTLVPSFFLIGGWGGPERRLAAIKFVVYTFASSVLMLASLLYLGLQANSFDITNLAIYAQGMAPSTTTLLVLIGLLAGFSVKAAIFPFHSWLVSAYTEAPAPVSAIFSGLLAKLGTYGFIRLVVPSGLLSDHVVGNIGHPFVLALFAVLATFGILYGAMLAFAQSDTKRVLAFSSLSHMGFIVLAILAVSTAGHQGGFLYMLNHGISTGALFLMLGMLEQRLNTRSTERFAGLGKLMPVYSFFLVLFVMSSIGLPGTNGFVSEFLCIISAFNSTTYSGILGIVAAGGVVLGAIYLLTLVARMLFGVLKLPEGVEPSAVTDLNSREIFTLVPLAVLVIALGFAPGFVLESVKLPLELSTQLLDAPAQKALESIQAAPAAQLSR